MNKLIPMPGFVLVEPIKGETEGAWLMSEVNMEKQQKGVVVSCGEEVTNEWNTQIKCPVKEGDVIYHRSWGHETINIDGRELRVVKFLDVCLKVEN